MSEDSTKHLGQFGLTDPKEIEKVIDVMSMKTPKEEAERIIKMYDGLGIAGTHIKSGGELAALIHVNGIIKEHDLLDDNGNTEITDNKFLEHFLNRTKFWIKVRDYLELV